MGLSPQELASVLGRAKTLCNMDNQINEAAAANRDRINNSFGGPEVSAYDGDAAKWDAMFSDSAAEDYDAGTYAPSQISGAAFERSGLPDNIKESFKKRSPISPQSSVKDALSAAGQALMESRPVVTEARQNVVPQGGGVDYSVIKAIVSECIREYFSTNSLLTENSLKSIGLSKGVISLVDNSGNVYKAKLEKIGNTNDKK